MALIDDTRTILADTLGLGDRALALQAQSRLLGALPEFDSVAVIEVIAALEERFDLTVADDEIDASSFETLGSLMDFIAAKRGAA